MKLRGVVALILLAVSASLIAQNQSAGAAQFDAWYKTRSLPLFSVPNAPAVSWQEMGPGMILRGWNNKHNAGRMTSLAVSPVDSKLIFATAASGGIWRSDNGGDNWNPVADFAPSLSYGSIEIDTQNAKIIYAGQGEQNNSADSFAGSGFMRSVDNGFHWQLLAQKEFSGQRFSRIVSHPHIPGLVYAATTRGVVRSIDYGQTWVTLLPGVATDLAINPRSPNEMLAALGNARGAEYNGLYRSTDGGNSWNRIQGNLQNFNGSELGRLQFGQCRDYPNVLYVAMYSSIGRNAGLLGFLKTEDFGSSWIELPKAPSYAGGSAWYYNVVAIAPNNPNVIFLCGTSTYRSVDGGHTFEDVTRSYGDGPVHPDHHWIAFDPSVPNTMYLCTDGGVFRSTDLGTHWEPRNNDLATVQFQYLDVHPTDPGIAYGGTQDNGTLKFTGNYYWPNVEAGDGGYTMVNPKNPNIVYAQYVNLELYRSKDAGKTWEWGKTVGINRSEGTLFYTPFNLDPQNPDVLVTGTNRVYMSTDGEDSWFPISKPLGGGLVSAVTIAPNNSNVIYAATTVGKVWVTPNRGKEWYEIDTGIPKAYVSTIAIDPNNARIAYLGVSSFTEHTLWKTTDAGGHWTDISDEIPPVEVHQICLDPFNSSTVFVGTDIGVFASTSGGGHWFRYGSNLPGAPIYSVVANRVTGYLTVGTHGRGGWRAKLPEVLGSASGKN